MEQTNFRNNNYSQYLPYVFGGIAAAAATYITYRWYSSLNPSMTADVKANLPVAKNLKTIPDVEGNYDLDGVSFDSEGVIVSSDDNKPVRPTLKH